MVAVESQNKQAHFKPVSAILLLRSYPVHKQHSKSLTTVTEYTTGTAPL